MLGVHGQLMCLLKRSSLITFFFRMYHSARLRWNSIERRRGDKEDKLIDNLIEWSMWHYAISEFRTFWIPVSS